MTNSQRLATVRDHLRRWLQEQVVQEGLETDATGDTPDSQASTEPQPAAKIAAESILIRDGFYAGRTFDAIAGEQAYRATWFMEPDELKIHDAAGTVAAVFSGDEIQSVLVEELAEESDVTDSDENTQGPISIPMPIADESVPGESLPGESLPARDGQSDEDDQISKAA